MKCWKFITVIWMPLFAEAQHFTVSKDTASIGEVIELKWHLHSTQNPTETAFVWQRCQPAPNDNVKLDIEWEKNLGDGFQLKSDTLLILPKKTERKIKIIFFDPGHFCLTSKNQSQADIYIKGPKENVEEITDIMGLEDFKMPDKKWLYWLVGLLIILLGAAIYYWQRNKKPNAPEVSRMPFKNARDRIYDILQMKHESESLEEAATALSAAARQLCIEQHDLKAFELSSSELLSQLKLKSAQKNSIDLLSRILQKTDAVKFAKASVLWPEIDEYCHALLELMSQKNDAHGVSD